MGPVLGVTLALSGDSQGPDQLGLTDSLGQVPGTWTMCLCLESLTYPEACLLSPLPAVLDGKLFCHLNPGS